MKKTGLLFKKLEYGGNLETASMKDDVINNLDKINCPMKCIMKNLGCFADYDGTKLYQENSIIYFKATDFKYG